jgi:hypothetical protein
MLHCLQLQVQPECVRSRGANYKTGHIRHSVFVESDARIVDSWLLPQSAETVASGCRQGEEVDPTFDISLLVDGNAASDFLVHSLCDPASAIYHDEDRAGRVRERHGLVFGALWVAYIVRNG